MTHRFLRSMRWPDGSEVGPIPKILGSDTYKDRNRDTTRRPPELTAMFSRILLFVCSAALAVNAADWYTVEWDATYVAYAHDESLQSRQICPVNLPPCQAI